MFPQIKENTLISGQKTSSEVVYNTAEAEMCSNFSHYRLDTVNNFLSAKCIAQ